MRPGRWQGLGASRNKIGVLRLSPWSDPTIVDRIEEPTSPQALRTSDSLENGFCPDEIETRVGRQSD
jgi:hypothetical protein